MVKYKVSFVRTVVCSLPAVEGVEPFLVDFLFFRVSIVVWIVTLWSGKSVSSSRSVYTGERGDNERNMIFKLTSSFYSYSLFSLYIIFIFLREIGVYCKSVTSFKVSEMVLKGPSLFVSLVSTAVLQWSVFIHERIYGRYSLTLNFNF